MKIQVTKKKKNLCLFFAILISATSLSAHNYKDSTQLRNFTTDEIVVTGTRNSTDIRHLPMTITVLNHEKLSLNQQSSLLPTLSEQVPSLFVTSRGVMGYGVSTGAAGGISLRGISSGNGQLLVLIDGHPQYMGLFGHPISDVYLTNMAEQVEVLRGPASVLYGSNAMGGVINIVTRKIDENGSNTNVKLGIGSYGTLETEASNRFKSGGVSSIVSGQYKRSDNHRPNMGFEQYGGYAKLSYGKGSWNYYGDINLTHFISQNPGQVSAPISDNKMWITRGLASLGIENHYEKTSGAVSAYYSWGHHKINDGYLYGKNPQTAYYMSDDQMLGMSIFQSAEFFYGNRITLGADIQHFGGHAWNESISTGETTNTLVDRSENELAIYLDIRQNIGNWLSLDLGLRNDYHTQVGNEIIPQGGLVFHLPRKAELKAMIGKGFRNPNMREMYMFPPQNSDLQPERIINYELSFNQQILNQKLKYGITLFYIDGDNLIQTVRVEGRPKNINTGEIKNYGVELTGLYRMNSNIEINGNYSYLHMDNPILAAPEHKVYAGATYHANKLTINSGVQVINGLYKSVGETPLKENFILLNTTVMYQYNKILQMYLRGENLLAQKYEINYGFPMPRATFMSGVNFNF